MSKEKSDLRECCIACIKKKASCPVKDCRQWINYEEDLNCCLIAVEKHGSMTLREVSERLHLTFVRIKQIQDKAVKKLVDANSDEDSELKVFEDYIREGNNFLDEGSKNKELFED